MSADRLQPIGKASWVDAEHVVAVRPGKDRFHAKILLDSGAEMNVGESVHATIARLNGGAPQ